MPAREWILARKGPLMTGAGPIGLFVKTRPELDSPDVQYQFLAGSAPKTGDPMHRFPACTLVAIPCRPESRGWLRITSARSDAAAGDAAELPVDAARQGHHRRRPAGDRARSSPPRRCGARCTEEICPARRRTTDEDLLNHVRATAGTTFHQTSTCMMGPGPMAVVDTELRVKGLQGLRVIDAVDHADRGVGQHQRHGHHDRREGGRHDPSGGVTQAGVVRDPMQRFGCDGSGQRYRPVASSQGRRAKDAAPTTFEAITSSQ